MNKIEIESAKFDARMADDRILKNLIREFKIQEAQAMVALNNITDLCEIYLNESNKRNSR